MQCPKEVVLENDSNLGKYPSHPISPKVHGGAPATSRSFLPGPSMTIASRVSEQYPSEVEVCTTWSWQGGQKRKGSISLEYEGRVIDGGIYRTSQSESILSPYGTSQIRPAKKYASGIGG